MYFFVFIIVTLVCCPINIISDCQSPSDAFDAVDIEDECLYCLNKRYHLYEYDKLCFKCQFPAFSIQSALILGNLGGKTNLGHTGGAGGGGATQVGSNAVNGMGGNGGEGYLCNITGINIVYGSGGGGGCRGAINGLGGTNAGSGGITDNNGVSNTGGGGGGGQGNGIAGFGGKGGSGIVVVRYLSDASVEATGGNQVFDYLQWKVHVFTTVGQEQPFNLRTSKNCEILIVGGGGGGLNSSGLWGPGGGGGGGQVIHYQNLLLAPKSYSVLVGDGGLPAANGMDSYFGNFRAIGGGRSFGFFQAKGIGNGGSGGGANRNWGYNGLAIPTSQICNATAIAVCQPGHFLDKIYSECKRCPVGMEPDLLGVSNCRKCPPGKYRPFDENGVCINCPEDLWSIKEMYILGNDGGNSSSVNFGAGGGGGASYSGENGMNLAAGQGGEGYYISKIDSTLTVFGSGGGSASADNDAYKYGRAGTNAGGYSSNSKANTGGGGGGRVISVQLDGGKGGSGVVMIRYPILLGEDTIATGGNQLLTINQWKVHQFLTVGNHTFTLKFTRPCDILIVGGGGSGGASINGTTAGGAGGGGGQVIHMIEYYLPPGTYSISVGAGGQSSNGGDSRFENIVAIGGGMGGGRDGLHGRDGGSGGGAASTGKGGMAIPPPPNILPGVTLRKIVAGWAIQSFTKSNYQRNKFDSCIDCPFASICNETHIVSCLSEYYRTPSRCVKCPSLSQGMKYDLHSCKCLTGHAFDLVRNECVACPAGFEPNSSGTACEPCPPNYFRSDMNLPTCLKCPENSICNSTYFNCPAGFEWNPQNQTCDRCRGGYSKSTEGLTSCDTCPIGTDSLKSNGTTCNTCEDGRFRPSTQFHDGCVECPEFSTCSSINMTCLAGYTPGATPFTCDQCQSKYFKPLNGNHACDPCPTELNSSDDYQSCVACPVGEYLISDNNCTKCPAGQEPNYSRTTCVACALGSYKSESMTRCSSCPLRATCTSTGFQCNAGNSLNSRENGCIMCPNGYIKPESGNNQCTFQCPIGTKSNYLRTECIDCPDGTFRNSLEYPFCLECPVEGVKSCQSSSFTCLPGWKSNNYICIRQAINTDERLNIITTTDSRDKQRDPINSTDQTLYTSSLYYFILFLISSAILFGFIAILILRNFKRKLTLKLEGYINEQRLHVHNDSTLFSLPSIADVSIKKIPDKTTSFLEYAQDVAVPL